MAGSKKKKLKKSSPPPHPPPAMDQQDEELMDELIAQLDSQNENVQSEAINVLNEIQLKNQGDGIYAGGKHKARERFEARQARKAIALAQTYSPDDPATEERLEREAKDEEKDIDRVCHDLHLQVHEITPDGHCLFSAIADQLVTLGALPPSQANYVVMRQTASNYMLMHPDDFVPFLPSAQEDEGSLNDGLMTPGSFERYCASVRDTAMWGGEPEILALSRAYGIPIHVIQGGHPSIVVHDPGKVALGGTDERRVVRISYHRKMYGLGEHYNSLRPRGALSQLSHKIQTILSPN